MESKDYDLVSIFDNNKMRFVPSGCGRNFWAGRAVTNLAVIYCIVYLFIYFLLKLCNVLPATHIANRRVPVIISFEFSNFVGIVINYISIFFII